MEKLKSERGGTVGRVGSWQDQVATASGLCLLLGVWLMVSPFMLGYTPVWGDLLFGAFIALFGGLVATVGMRETWLGAFNLLAGLWLVFAAFWVDELDAATANHATVGALVALLAGWSMAASYQGQHQTSTSTSADTDAAEQDDSAKQAAQAGRWRSQQPEREAAPSESGYWSGPVA